MLLFYLSIWVYIPVIAGILLPMILFIPLAYISWNLLALWGSNGWYDSWFVINPDDVYRVYLVCCVELFIFIGGFLLFGFSLYHLIKERRHNIKITNTGPYKFIRHPQNLGIIMMLFPFILYIPGFGDIGIRSGEIISWMIFSLLIIIISILEEQGLKKKYPEEFKRYSRYSGFFFPKVNPHGFHQEKSNKFAFTFRYGALILGFIICVILVYVLMEYLLGIGILIQYRN